MIRKAPGVTFVNCIDMKALIKTLILLAILTSCKNQHTTVSSTTETIIVKQVTSQISYPGVSDGRNQYKQRWMFQLEKGNENSGVLSLLLKDRLIEIGELVQKGIVIGDDNNDVLLSIDAIYPLELNYPKSEIEESTTPRLLYENEGGQQIIVLDSVIVLNDIIYPSVAH